MRFVVTGGTGFIGKASVAELSAIPGSEIVVPSRTERRKDDPRVAYVRWDPEGESLDPALVEGAEAVVHFAGETAVGRRLTASAREKIRGSRLTSTRLLVDAMAKTRSRPRTFVCASAVGYYGPRDGHETAVEETLPGNDFLAELCVDWEREARRAEALGVRVVCARLGIVLGKNGGALEKMAAPIRAFVGGKLGSGTQVVSWIHLRDVARAIRFVATDERFSGPVNLTAPGAVTNAELTEAIAKCLRRPAFASVPSFALRLALGDGAEPLLTGQRVAPKRLLENGFVFDFPSLDEALKDALR